MFVIRRKDRYPLTETIHNQIIAIHFLYIMENKHFISGNNKITLWDKILFIFQI